MYWLARRWLLLALMASLALNAGVGATVGVQAYRQRCHDPGQRRGGPRGQHLIEALGLSAEQSEQVKTGRERMRAAFGELRPQMREADGALAELLAAPEPDREAIAEQMARIGSLQARKLECVVEHFLEIKALLEPEQQEAYNDVIRRRLLSHDKRGPGFGGRHGPGKKWGHRRGGRGKPGATDEQGQPWQGGSTTDVAAPDAAQHNGE